MNNERKLTYWGNSKSDVMHKSTWRQYKNEWAWMCFNETLSKQTAVCRLWTPELLYTCNKTIKSGFHKTNETPLPFLKKFPPSPNRSVWTFPTEGATLIEQTCGGGSVCSKVRKFLTTTKIVFVQQITVVFLMYSQTIPRMLSLVF